MKLNKTEKTILEYLKSNTFKSIYRTNALYENDIGQLWAKREDGIMIQLAGFGNFFEEIKNGEEYEIEELLKGE